MKYLHDDFQVGAICFFGFEEFHFDILSMFEGLDSFFLGIDVFFFLIVIYFLLLTWPLPLSRLKGRIEIGRGGEGGGVVAIATSEFADEGRGGK